MTQNELDTLMLEATSTNDDNYEEYNHPLDINDIINICREYNNLGWKLQNQVETIIEVGIEESIISGIVRKDSLPQIKSFLRSINKNPYFGDAVIQALDCLKLIQQYEEKHKIFYVSKSN